MEDFFCELFKMPILIKPGKGIVSIFILHLLGCDDKAEILRYLDLFYETLNGKEIMLSSTHSQKINASAGFVWTSSTDDSISEFLSRADDALYKVKKDNKWNA